MKRDLRQREDPYIGWGIGLGVVLFVMYVYPGFMTPLTAHFDGSCTTLPLQASAEDLRIDPATGFAYLTYYDSVDTRRPERAPASTSTGTIMLVDLNAAEPHVRAALASDPADFKPSGLSLFTKADGTKRLFVTSRYQLGKHSVEIFDQSSTGAFTHVETIRDSKLWSPTAIVAVGPRQFYVVNQLGFKRSYDGNWGVQTRDRMRGNEGTVAYYDGEQMKIVASGLGLPVGIALSPDGRTAYVSQASRNIIQKYARDTQTDALTQKEWIRIPGSPRNVTVDADGTLWVSAQPRGLPFTGWFDDDGNGTPTQVFKVTPTADADKQVEEIYLNDDGKELSDGSVAAPLGGGRFVVGSRTDHKLLMCTQSGTAKPADPAAKTTT